MNAYGSIREGVRIPFPSKLKSILIFTQSPPSPPSQGPPSPPNLRAHKLGHGPSSWATSLRFTKGPARPVDQSTGSVARPGLGHGPYSSGPAGLAWPIGDPCLDSLKNFLDKSRHFQITHTHPSSLRYLADHLRSFMELCGLSYREDTIEFSLGGIYTHQIFIFLFFI